MNHQHYTKSVLSYYIADNTNNTCYVPTLVAKFSTSFKALISPFFPSLALASASLSFAAINAFLVATTFFSVLDDASVAFANAVLASPNVFFALAASADAVVACFLAFSKAAFSAANGSTTGAAFVAFVAFVGVVVVVVVVVVAGVDVVVDVIANAGSIKDGVEAVDAKKMVDAAKMERMDFFACSKSDDFMDRDVVEDCCCANTLLEMMLGV